MREKPRFTLGQWLGVPVIGVLTWIAHEVAHWAMGTALGYEMWISLNQVGLASGAYEPTWHSELVTAAGPLLTYLQAAVALWVVLRRRNLTAYAFLYFATFMRAVAFLVSFLSPNDEARLSLAWGLPMWALPTVVVAVLFGMAVVGSRRLNVGWKENLGLYLIASSVAAALVLGDQALRSALSS